MRIAKIERNWIQSIRHKAKPTSIRITDVKRIDEDCLSKLTMSYKANGRICIGCPRKRWFVELDHEEDYNDDNQPSLVNKKILLKPIQNKIINNFINISKKRERKRAVERKH